jgi:hypothetical protein
MGKHAFASFRPDQYNRIVKQSPKTKGRIAAAFSPVTGSAYFFSFFPFPFPFPFFSPGLGSLIVFSFLLSTLAVLESCTGKPFR